MRKADANAAGCSNEDLVMEYFIPGLAHGNQAGFMSCCKNDTVSKLGCNAAFRNGGNPPTDLN